MRLLKALSHGPVRPAIVFALTLLLLLLLLLLDAARASALRFTWQHGANFESWQAEQYAWDLSDASLARLAATGVTDVAVTAWWAQDTPTSSVLTRDQNSPTDQSLRQVIQRAKSLGLHPVVKLHVLIRSGGTGGNVQPIDPAKWFSYYRQMVDRYASIAQQEGASTLVLGTELWRLNDQDEQWRRVISDARARFAGKLTYAADTWRLQEITWWDALDFIGIDFYKPLVEDEPNPTVERLMQEWSGRGYLRELADLSERWNRKVLLTEIGYRSIPYSTRLPWESSPPSVEASQEPQARAYEAAYRVLSSAQWCAGVYWWDWQPWGSPSDDGFSAEGKLAEGVIRQWAKTPIPPPPAPEPSPVPQPAPAPAPSPAPAPAAAAAPVRILAMRITPRRLHLARARDRRRHRPAQPATRARVTVRTSRSASLTVVVQAQRPGVRRGSACVAPSPSARGRRCTRRVTLPGVRRVSAPGGIGRFTLAPAIGGRALAPGRYRLVVTAVDISGNRVGLTTAAFTVTP